MPLTGTQKTNLAAVETAIQTLLTSLAPVGTDVDKQAIWTQYRRTQKYSAPYKSHKDK